MWFDNPFTSNNQANLTLLLKNLGLKRSEEKRSTTVDVWRGNYDEFTDPPPRITIIKKYKDPKDEIADVKTLYPDALPPTPRTLLCHHATNESGHVTCHNPGKCSEHRLAKPSAFEVSKLDECRTVIDLYQEGVMSGVINAERQVSRDSTNQRYSQVEYGGQDGGDCTNHTNCRGNCKLHSTSTPSLPTYQPETRLVPKRQVVKGPKCTKVSSLHHRAADEQKSVHFRDQVKCACVGNCNCGWRTVGGRPCARDPENKVRKRTTSSEGCGKVKDSCDTEIDGKSCTQKLLPPCYYQHARQRMQRLKEKSRTLVEKSYSAPSSLARSKSYSLIKKYSAAKQTSLKRKKFVVPNVSPDCLYQPTKPKRPTSAPPSRGNMDFSTVDKYQQRQVPLINNRGVKKVNLRQTYPRKRDIGRESSSMDTIKVAVDKIGPLVYAVQNGKIMRMKMDS